MTGLHYTEEKLAELVRSGHPVADDDHLGVCAMCRERYTFIMEFEQRLRQEMEAPADGRLGRLVRQILPSHVVVLHRFRPEVDMRDLGVGRHTMLLAAQHTVEEPLRYAHTATFAAEDAGVLVRVVKDRTTGSASLYVLGDDPLKQRHILLLLKNAAGIQVVSTDSEGLATIEGDFDWESAEVTLLTPVETLMMSQDIHGRRVIRSEAVALEVSLEDSSLHIRLLEKPDEPLTRVVAVYNDRQTSFASLIEDAAVVTVPEGKTVMEIRLFN